MLGYLKKHALLRNLLIDILCAGAALVVFALFHHVLPRNGTSLGMVSSRESVDADHALIGAVEDRDGGGAGTRRPVVAKQNIAGLDVSMDKSQRM